MGIRKEQFNNNSIKVFFEEIYDKCFNKNFGRMSKSELDLLFFKFYIQECEVNNVPTDDYSLSKSLGVTQTKIRNLKKLKYKQFGIKNENWWKEELNKSLKNVHFDKKENKIKVIINDVNVKEEVINYIEVKGWYDEPTLNKKLLTIPIGCYIDIFVDSDSFIESFDDNSIKKLKEKCKKENLEDGLLTNLFSNPSKDALYDILKTGTKEILKIVLQTLPFGGMLATVVKTIVKVIDKSI